MKMILTGLIRLAAISLIALLILLLIVLPARSSDVVTVNSEGYSYSDGYYWADGYPYAREWVYGSQGYYYYQGCYRYYYPGTAGYYKYTRVPYVVKKVTSTDPEWRTKLLEIAKQRDAFELRNRADAFQQAYFLDAVRALGLNFSISNYGAPAPYATAYNGYGAMGGYGGSLQLGSYGVNANTVYGYSLKQATDLYGSTDLNALYQQVGQATKNAQQLAGQAHTDLSDLAGQAGTNAARVAEILAKGQAAAAALSASKAEPQVKSETRIFTFRVGPEGKVEQVPTPGVAPGVPGVPPMPQADDVALGAWRTFATASCASCHGGDKPKANFDVLRDYPNLAPEKVAAVWERMLTADDTKRMPPAPAARVTPEQFRLWILKK